MVFQLEPLVELSHLTIFPTFPLRFKNPVVSPEQTTLESDVIVPPTVWGRISIRVELELETELPLWTTAL